MGNDLAHGDVGGAMLDGIGFIPIAEGFKYIDDLAGLIKSGKKITVVLADGSKYTATINDLPKALQQLPSGTKMLDEAGNVIGEIGKEAGDVVEWVRMTTKQASEAAEKLGFRKTNYKTPQGEAVFYNPKTKTYISQDIGSGNGMGPNNGGVWKQAKTPEGLASKNTRMGTYDSNLNRIGD